MPIIDRRSAAVCNECGSQSVKCTASYCTNGADMEHVEHMHQCAECGATESAMQSGTYGYDHEYTCGLRHSDDVQWGHSGQYRVVRREGENGKHVICSGLNQAQADQRRAQLGCTDAWVEAM